MYPQIWIIYGKKNHKNVGIVVVVLMPMSMHNISHPQVTCGGPLSQFSHVHPDEVHLSAHLELTFVTLELLVAAR